MWIHAPSHGRIFDRLVEEHRQIVAMFDRALAQPTPEGCAAAFAEIAHFLRAHERAEEEILYPELEGSREIGDHVAEDRREHADLEARMRVLEALPPDSGAWSPLVRDLRDAFVRHAADEEQVLFAGARTRFGDDRSELLLIEYEMDRDLALKHS